MRIVVLTQCDAWVPVSKGETPLAGKRAIWPGQRLTLPEGTQFAPFPPMNKDRANRAAPKPVSVEQAIKDGLIKREKSS